MANQIGVSLTNSKALIILILLFVVASFAVTRSISPNAAPNYNWASPREADEAWMDLHLLLKNTVQHAAENDGLQLIFYGDSITESMRGTSMGQYTNTDVPHVYGKYFRGRYRTEALAIAGDQTSHLMWRLLQGESPHGTGASVAVVLIGTNDLGFAQRMGADLNTAADTTIDRVATLVDYLLQQEPTMHVVLQGLLPRGFRSTDTHDIVFDQPSIFTPHLQRVNDGMQAYAADKPGVTYVYCGDVLLEPNGHLNQLLIPDALHPNGQGMEAIFQCLEPIVLPILGPSETIGWGA